ncbi:MAG: hypothetical protein AAFY76_20950, partial [Cyanobacteria bacterium J06649_11]
MTRFNSKVFALVSFGNIMLSTLLMSVGVAEAKSVNNYVIAQASTEQQIERLERQQENTNQYINQTTFLFNTLLATLVVLMIGVIISIFLLRRAVFREVTNLVTARFKELGDLEAKIASANKQVQKL